MHIISFLLKVSLILSVHRVKSSPNDIGYLKDHFIASLIEENREISSMQLTDDIERSINLKVEGFLNIINEEPTKRVQRDTNDVLLNEKTTDVFILKGFESRGFVPVNFPQDICLFKIDKTTFAAGLTSGNANETSGSEMTLLVFVREARKFRKIHEYSSKYLKKIDCESTSDSGFISVVNAVTSSDIKGAEDLLLKGSFILRIFLNFQGKPIVEVLQKIALLNQNGVRLWSRSQNLYLVYSYDTSSTSPLTICTIYKLDGSHFNKMDDLPCQNAHVIEFFLVNHNIMMLIGNYRDNNGTTDAFSSIMRYDLNLQRFTEHQKILTHAIAVGRYFYLDHQNERQHFLFIGNTFEIDEFGLINYEVPSMIYKFVNGYFIPMQTINIKHVQAVQPIIGNNNEFHLLIASEEHEIQIFLYDGWKFNESPIDFTGYAFGSGVVNIRAYDNIINGTTTIVLANRDSFDPTWNVYTPIYSMKNDSTRLKSSISKWCADAFSRMENFDVDETDRVLKSAANLVDSSSDHANFLGKVFIRNSSIGVIKAKELKGTRVSFNNETAKRVNSLFDRLNQLSSAVQHVNNKIKFTKATQRTRRQAPVLIKTLIVDGPLNIQSINGKPVADLVYKFNRRNNRLQDVIVKEILISEQLFVNGKVDGVEVMEDNVILNTTKQVLRPMRIEKLSTSDIEVANVNGLPFQEFFALLKQNINRKIPNTINELNVETLSVGRFLNQRNFTAIAINSLKTSGDQLINAFKLIGKLQANRVMFQKVLSDHTISDVPLAMLINVNDTRQRLELNRDIRFTDDLSINRLFVNERINNVKVKDGQLQVLRKRGLTHQIVTGEKFFDQINLLSPIVLQGKIESKSLQKMNPIITINKDMVLQGDYRINGPVTIRRIIKAKDDILSKNPKLGLKGLLSNGLNLFTTNMTGNNLVFQGVVEVERNLDAFSLNQKPLAQFVKANYPDQQTIHGFTTFNNGLMVHDGTVQADSINDVEINQLNKTILKRFSTVTQFIDGNVEIVSLQTPYLVSPEVSLNGKNIDLLLSTNKKQELLQVSLPQAKVVSMKATNVQQEVGGKVFGSDLNFLINDVVTKKSLDDGSIIIAEKHFTDLNVNHLVFSDQNEWKSIIKNYENSVAQDVNITGPFVFNSDMKVDSLVFTGKINDISYQDMTNNWLQTEGEQVFTAPQILNSMSIDSNLVLLKQTINGVNIATMVNESIWIDGPIYFEEVEIDGEVTVWGETMTPTVNGISLEGKILLNNTNEQQVISKLVIDKDLIAEYINFTSLNGIDCVKLTNALVGDSETANLRIYGNVRFNYQPEIHCLNYVELKELHESIWLTNRDVVLTGDDIQFIGSVTSKGPFFANTINDKDLGSIYQNYFSLSKNQNIATYLNLNGSMIIKKALLAQKTLVQGSIKASDTDKGLKIDEFAKNVLRLGHKQDISGNWKVKRLIIDGDYSGTINGYNFINDVLHKGNWKTAEITGSKRIHSIEAYDVKVPYLNEIDVLDWITNAVSLNSTNEQIIEGKVELAHSVFYDDVEVHGTVNGLIITPETVLTKSGESQIITGDLTIKTMTSHEAKPQVKPSFIEHLFLRYGINGKNLTDIYENSLKTSDSKLDSKRLVFDEKLSVGSIETSNNIYGVNVGEFLRKSEASNELVKFQHNLEHLRSLSEDIKASFHDSAVELSHFEHHQSLHGVNIQKTVPFTTTTGDAIIAVHERNMNKSLDIIRFFRWSRESNLFVMDQTMNPIQYSLKSFEITKFGKVIYKSVHHLYMEVYEKSSKTFHPSLMVLDQSGKTFVSWLQSESKITSQWFTLDDGASACYGSFFPSFGNLITNCEGQLPTVLKTAPIRMVSSQNGFIILLTDDHQIQVWYEQKIRQILKVLNPQSFTCIQHEGRFYLAVTSDKVEQSIHHGSIEVFESSEDINFVLVQSLELENPHIVKFSVIPSGDLLLYILTKNAGKTLSIYKYAGASYFVESIGSLTIVNTGSDLSTIQVDGISEFIAIVSGEVFIIEAVLREY